MSENDLLSRITVNPKIFGGKAVSFVGRMKRPTAEADGYDGRA